MEGSEDMELEWEYMPTAQYQGGTYADDVYKVPAACAATGEVSVSQNVKPRRTQYCRRTSESKSAVL